MLDLYLIRHAESVLNLDYAHVIGGRTNAVPLTSEGIRQAERLGPRLSAEKIVFDHVYSSTAVRAWTTARHTGKTMHPGFTLESVVQDERLLELDQGAWEGKPREEIYTSETLAKIRADPWEFRPPQGESQRDVEERMYRWMKQTALPVHDGVIAVFTHGMAIKCLLRKILDFDSKMTYKLEIDNTAITHLRYDLYGWHLATINDTGHLLSVLKKPDVSLYDA